MTVFWIFFFFVFALIIARMAFRSTMTPCLACGLWIPRAAVYCTHCNRTTIEARQLRDAIDKRVTVITINGKETRL